MFKIRVLGMSQGRHFRTPLERPWNVSPKFLREWISSFLLPAGTQKLHFKNVIAISFIKCVKMTFLGDP